MNTQLEYLIKLQDIDAQILARTRAIERFPEKMRSAESPLAESQVALNRLKQKRDDLEKKKRDRERALEEMNEKIKKLKARTGEIKTNKEYQALLKEIETVERERSTLEDDILAVMVDIDAIIHEMTLAEQQYAKNSERVEALKREIEQERTALERELASMKEARTRLVEQIDRDVYDEYIGLIELHSGLAVNEVRDEICQGCNMNIPPQLFVEIKKNEEIFHCPHCRRILYYRERVP